MSQKDMKSIH